MFWTWVSWISLVSSSTTQVTEISCTGSWNVTRLGVMLKVMVMHCNAIHVFKVMLEICNDTFSFTSNGNSMHYFPKSIVMLALLCITLHYYGYWWSFVMYWITNWLTIVFKKRKLYTTHNALRIILSINQATVLRIAKHPKPFSFLCFNLIKNRHAHNLFVRSYFTMKWVFYILL